MTRRARRMGPLVAALLAGACARDRPHPPDEHTVLASAFVGRDTSTLRALLHPDLVVQPPPPDSASAGRDAEAYLLALAASTDVAASRLHPTSVVKEGPFLLEEGTWFMEEGERMLRARYQVRWRPEGDRWRLVLLRWSRFR